jgi:hypothetical protein
MTREELEKRFLELEKRVLDPTDGLVVRQVEADRWRTITSKTIWSLLGSAIGLIVSYIFYFFIR